LRTFEEFSKQVKDSCESHAQRKGYTTSDVDGENQLLRVAVALGIHDQHSIGEIVYKCAEYLKAPRDVLLIKIAGWAYIVWKARQE
jgi:hypothetical protein